MKCQEFSPRKSVERSLARWWIVVLLMIMGGIIGWIFHIFQPPIYEAKAVLTVNIDFGSSHFSQYEEDHAFSAAGAIVNSSEVKGLVITEAKADGYSLDLNQIQKEFSLERKQSVWELRVRDRDPRIAADLANIWAKNAFIALNTALGHALRADQLKNQNDNSDNSELAKEKILSVGIISSMSFGLTEFAVAPEKPLLYGQASMVMAGALIGFIISLWAVNNLRVFRCD